MCEDTKKEDLAPKLSCFRTAETQELVEGQPFARSTS